MKITIVGAGLAGLFAANVLKRYHDVSVSEAQASLPNNHSAVLRFRSPGVGDILGIPFRRVNLIKAALPWRNPVADALAYSFKNTGQRRSDRSISHEILSSERWIAPPDLIPRMAASLGDVISYEKQCGTKDFMTEGLISTIPMPALMNLLDYPKSLRPKFGFKSGTNIKAKIKDCDAYVSIIVVDPVVPFSRISITGDELIVETILNENADDNISKAFFYVCPILGITHDDVYDVTESKSRYAKILPVDDDLRKSFIHWATTNHGVYSLGRFATWRPGLLLDDLIQDVRLIEKWMVSKSSYDRARAK